MNEKTISAIAAPGASTSHGHRVICPREVDSKRMNPQVGFSAELAPSDRNDSAASARIVPPIVTVASTITGATMFGRMWRKMIRGALAPTVRAASM